jgi:hypothetical protein
LPRAVAELRAVAFRRLRQLFDELRELPEVVLVDLVPPLQLRLFVW